MKTLLSIFLLAITMPYIAKAQQQESLSVQQRSLVAIAALAAKGDLEGLQPVLHQGLDAGLHVNQLKESLLHLYAYAGFPRSIRGLQTLMTVLAQRKQSGIRDTEGPMASSIQDERPKYERGKDILQQLTGVAETGPKTGYAAFAPQVEVFLKEHLFADIFERDILTYTERELLTIAILSSIGGAEPMLRSHVKICFRLGLSPQQLQEFVGIIAATVGEKEAQAAQTVVDELLNTRN